MNREKNYNKLFNANPHVGVMDPLQFKVGGSNIKPYGIELHSLPPFETVIQQYCFMCFCILTSRCHKLAKYLLCTVTGTPVHPFCLRIEIPSNQSLGLKTVLASSLLNWRFVRDLSQQPSPLYSFRQYKSRQPCVEIGTAWRSPDRTKCCRTMNVVYKWTLLGKIYTAHVPVFIHDVIVLQRKLIPESSGAVRHASAPSLACSSADFPQQVKPLPLEPKRPPKLEASHHPVEPRHRKLVLLQDSPLSQKKLGNSRTASGHNVPLHPTPPSVSPPKQTMFVQWMTTAKRTLQVYISQCDIDAVHPGSFYEYL